MEKHVTETETEKTIKELWGKHNLVLLVQSQNSITSETQAVYLFLKYINTCMYIYRWLVGAVVWKYSIIITLKKILFLL